jgi:hypothetical protein
VSTPRKDGALLIQSNLDDEEYYTLEVICCPEHPGAARV